MKGGSVVSSSNLMPVLLQASMGVTTLLGRQWARVGATALHG